MGKVDKVLAVGRPDGRRQDDEGVEKAPRRSPLTRGLQVLDYLQGRTASAAEAAGSLGVNRSTAHRLLRELEDAGYVIRDMATRRFLLAPAKFNQIGGPEPEVPPTAGGMGSDWHEGLQLMLSEIRDVVGESTMFSVPARDQMLYVAFFATDHPIGVHEAIGSGRPIHASAVGKAYLSALPPADLDVVLGRLSYSTGTEKAAKGPFQLRDMLGETGRLGYAIDRDETFHDLSCVATPVFVNKILVGAAGVTGPTHRLSNDRLRTCGELLVERVRRLAIS
jgi:DNA-binding IclR family transcriptional regulator